MTDLSDHPVLVDYLEIMARPAWRVSVGVPFRNGGRYIEDLTRFWRNHVKRQEALVRTSKLHKAYRAKRKGRW